MKKRWVPIWTTIILLIPVLAVAAPPIGLDLQAWMDQTDDRLVELEERVAALENRSTTSADSSSTSSNSSTTSTSSSTTSSSVPSTTATTTEATTTTTRQPTTTTTSEGATTTTVPSTSTATTTSTANVLAIPETQPYVSPNGLQDDEGFLFMLLCGDTETVTCDRDANAKRRIADFTYMGHGMPYMYLDAEPGHHDHAWWVAGDREGYGCAYAFMFDKHPNPFGGDVVHPDAHFIARAAIVRPPGQSYGMINDKYMAEGQRYLDGTLHVGSKEVSDEDCTTVLDDFDYDSYVPHGPDKIRVGLFTADGEIGDIRDFTDVTFRTPAHFEFSSFDGERVTILVILGATNKVSHVFYYDVMGDGRIAVEVNGQLFGG